MTEIEVIRLLVEVLKSEIDLTEVQQEKLLAFTNRHFEEIVDECYLAILAGINGKPGLTMREINRHKTFARLQPASRNKAIGALVAAKKIEFRNIPSKGAGRPRNVWVATTPPLDHTP